MTIMTILFFRKHYNSMVYTIICKNFPGNHFCSKNRKRHCINVVTKKQNKNLLQQISHHCETMIDQQRLKRAQRNEHDPPRSIDQFYEEASANDLTPLAIEYWIIFLALGLANSGDAAEITTMNFVLSNEDFDAEILLGDFKTRGSVLAACIFAGMLFGGLLVSKVEIIFSLRSSCSFLVTVWI